MFPHFVQDIYRQSVPSYLRGHLKIFGLTLLQPFSLMKGAEHLLHLRIKAADMASSMVWRAE